MDYMSVVGLRWGLFWISNLFIWAASWENRLFATYIDSIMPLLPKSKISSSSILLLLYSMVCVGPGRKPGIQGFLRPGSYKFADFFSNSWLNRSEAVKSLFSTTASFCGSFLFLRLLIPDVRWHKEQLFAYLHVFIYIFIYLFIYLFISMSIIYFCLFCSSLCQSIHII